jgi:hypothetical protein
VKLVLSSVEETGKKREFLGRPMGFVEKMNIENTGHLNSLSFNSLRKETK